MEKGLMNELADAKEYIIKLEKKNERWKKRQRDDERMLMEYAGKYLGEQMVREQWENRAKALNKTCDELIAIITSLKVCANCQWSDNNASGWWCEHDNWSGNFPPDDDPSVFPDEQCHYVPWRWKPRQETYPCPEN